MKDMFARLLAALSSGRAKLVDDTGAVQLVQVDQGPSGMDGSRKIAEKVPRIAEFGFTSYPPADSDMLLAGLAGNRTLVVVIGTNHQPSRARDLKEGDSALYDVRGARIWLSETGIQVDAAGLDVSIANADTVTVVADTKVRLEAPLVEITGDLTVAGSITASGDVLSNDGDVSLNGLHDAYNSHTHDGVKSGDDTSGGPSPEA